MLNILYFASVREQLGTSSEQLALPGNIRTVGDLTAMLAAREGAWSLLNDSSQVLIAVDQAVSDRNHVLQGSEEIAFFPPMTGG